jgi:hypothetical protein
MSIQQNFPAITPSLSLNFARSKKLDPRITFTRTSSATRTNETGLVEVVPANAPRFDHSYDSVSGSVRSLGLLVEESRSNTMTNSENFSTGWAGSGYVGILPWGSGSNTTADTSPNGQSTANLIIEDTSTGFHRLSKTGVTLSAGTYTFSIYVKKFGTINRNFAISSSVLDQGASFNLSEVTSTASTENSSITNVGNGWFRCSITKTISGSTGYIFLFILDENLNNQYTGDGTSGIYLWGAQLEAGAFPTSYIPTTNSTVTRTADNVSMVGENFSSWYNQSEGTIMWNGRYNAEDINLQCYSIDPSTPGGDLNNRIALFGRSGLVSGAFVPRIRSSGDNFDPASVGTPTIKGTLIKTALSYSIGSVTFTEGITSQIVTSSPTSLPTVSLIKIGADYSGTQFTNGTISQLIYYPRRLTNAQLVTLTR